MSVSLLSYLKAISLSLTKHINEENAKTISERKEKSSDIVLRQNTVSTTNLKRLKQTLSQDLFLQGLPPRLSSAVPWAMPKSFLTKHWYIPLSSLMIGATCRRSLDRYRILLFATMGLRFLTHVTEWTGCPLIEQLKVMDSPSSAVICLGVTLTFKGAEIRNKCGL